MVSRMQIDFKKYNADGIGSLHDFTQGSLLSSATLGYQKYNTDGVGSCAPSSPTNKQNHPRAIHPNETNRPCLIHPNSINHQHVICPNETVGAAPACPPERPRSGVSMPKIHALCAGDERWMRPCGATRAGTQAPPLPNSIIHPRTILPNDINHPNETRKQSTTHIGGGNASRTPAPIL